MENKISTKHYFLLSNQWKGLFYSGNENTLDFPGANFGDGYKQFAVKTVALQLLIAVS